MARYYNELSEQNSGFICTLVSIELIWVLKRCYRRDKQEIKVVIATCLDCREWVLEYEEGVAQVLFGFE